MPDFRDAMQRVREVRSQFLMVGRRWDADITIPLTFNNKAWDSHLKSCVLKQGRQRGPGWIDYFVFTRGLYCVDLPPFVVGRVFWDNWLVWKALASKQPVIDASASVLAVHQNHDYGYHPQGKTGVFHGGEALRNHELTGGWQPLRTIADATEILGRDGLKPNRQRHWTAAKRYMRRAALSLFHDVIERVWFLLLGLSRPARRKLGLRAENLRRFFNRRASLSGKHS